MTTLLDHHSLLASDILEKKERISIRMSATPDSDAIRFQCLEFYAPCAAFSNGIGKYQNFCNLSSHLKHEKYPVLTSLSPISPYAGQEKIWDALGEVLRDIPFEGIVITQPSPQQENIQVGSKIVSLSQFGKLVR